MYTLRALLCIILCFSAQASFGSGSVSFSPGMRQGGDVYHKQKTQPAMGIQAEVSLGEMPVYATAEVRSWIDYAFGDSGDYYTKRTDKSVGLKWMQHSGTIRPNLGAGIVQVRETVKHDDTAGGRSYSAHDTVDGYYMDAGVALKIKNHFNMGMGVRAIRCTKTMVLDNISGSANSVVAYLLFGYSWN